MLKTQRFSFLATGQRGHLQGLSQTLSSQDASVFQRKKARSASYACNAFLLSLVPPNHGGNPRSVVICSRKAPLLFLGRVHGLLVSAHVAASILSLTVLYYAFFFTQLYLHHQIMSSSVTGTLFYLALCPGHLEECLSYGRYLVNPCLINDENDSIAYFISQPFVIMPRSEIHTTVID